MVMVGPVIVHPVVQVDLSTTATPENPPLHPQAPPITIKVVFVKVTTEKPANTGAWWVIIGFSALGESKDLGPGVVEELGHLFVNG